MSQDTRGENDVFIKGAFGVFVLFCFVLLGALERGVGAGPYSVAEAGLELGAVLLPQFPQVLGLTA